MKILVIEDEAFIAALLAETLDDLGHDVCAIAATEADAVAAAHEHLPDLIIADASLTEGSGTNAVATILTTRPVAHVFVTGNASAVRAQLPNAIILQKPFFLPELEAAITAALLAPTTA